MFTDDEKTNLSKLLSNLEVPEVKITERCNSLLADFRKNFGKLVEEEMKTEVEKIESDHFINPFKVDKEDLTEIDAKLLEISSKRDDIHKDSDVINNEKDPKRPWRTNSCKEKLLRINGELKRL